MAPVLCLLPTRVRALLKCTPILLCILFILLFTLGFYSLECSCPFCCKSKIGYGLKCNYTFPSNMFSFSVWQCARMITEKCFDYGGRNYSFLYSYTSSTSWLQVSLNLGIQDSMSPDCWPQPSGSHVSGEVGNWFCVKVFEWNISHLNCLGAMYCT